MNHKKLKHGHALVEFSLVFPFFFILAVGSWDLIGLSLGRLSLEKKCSSNLLQFISKQTVPSDGEENSRFTFHLLPPLLSRSPIRAPRNIRIVQLELSKRVPLRFPLAKYVFGRETILLRAVNSKLQILYE